MYRRAVDGYLQLNVRSSCTQTKHTPISKKMGNSDLVKLGYQAIENTGFGRFFLTKLELWQLPFNDHSFVNTYVQFRHLLSDIRVLSAVLTFRNMPIETQITKVI